MSWATKAGSFSAVAAIVLGCEQIVGYDRFQLAPGADGGSAAVSAEFFIGVKHSCAVREDRSLWCWGLNDFGQLGIGGTKTELVPKRVAVDDVVFVNLGESHTCAVTQDGSVYCWGGNERGQLGIGRADGNTHDKPTKVDCSSARKVQAGRGHTCIETNTKTIECWGANEFGQLGDGTTVPKSLPTKVPGISGVAKMSIGGGDHTCAVAQSGDAGGNRAFCWGNNDKGQLGRPRAETASSATPLEVPQIVDPDKVFLGFEFSCATMPDTTVLCWGANEHGQLGDGTFATRSSPAPVSGVLGMTELGTGREHACGVERTSQVAKCWGSNEFGQLGARVGGNEPAPKALPTTGWDGVTTRGDHSCGVRAGRGYCWGRNDTGQLGSGSTKTSATPTVVAF